MRYPGKLHQDFRISVGGSNFLDLDSSTPKKFSRHVILHLPGGQVRGIFRDVAALTAVKGFATFWGGKCGVRAKLPDGTQFMFLLVEPCNH